MDDFEFYSGIIVVIIGAIIMFYSIYKVWINEEENPVDDIVPDE